uniref:Uncharacterized protein n=1 Tax=Strigamia maritima TaxID=126957 RepID=T1IX73_STRMM
MEFSWLKRIHGILLLVAFLFNMIVLAVYYYPKITLSDLEDIVIGSTFFILFYMVLAFTLGEKDIRDYSFTGLVFAIAHGILNLVIAGSLISRSLKKKSKNKFTWEFMVSGVCVCIVAIVLFVSIVFLIKNKRQYDED